MLEVEHKHNFLKKTHRINDKSVKERVKNQTINKIPNQQQSWMPPILCCAIWPVPLKEGRLHYAPL